MKDDLPDCIVQGEAARLFPVLSTTSKEGRTTSIVLACMSKIDEFGATLLQSVGQRLGKRSRLDTYTEVVCKAQNSGCKDRPDGLLVLRVGSREWKALVEAKVGNAELEADQVEGRARIWVTPLVMEILGLEVDSEGLELRGCLRSDEGVKDGALYARKGILSIGVQLIEGERDLKILRSRKWYRKQEICDRLEAEAAGGRW